MANKQNKKRSLKDIIAKAMSGAGLLGAGSGGVQKLAKNLKGSGGGKLVKKALPAGSGGGRQKLMKKLNEKHRSKSEASKASKLKKSDNYLEKLKSADYGRAWGK